MSFELDPEVAAALATIAEQSGPLPPPVGDIESRRSSLNATAAPLSLEAKRYQRSRIVVSSATVISRSVVSTSSAIG